MLLLLLYFEGGNNVMMYFLEVIELKIYEINSRKEIINLK